MIDIGHICLYSIICGWIASLLMPIATIGIGGKPGSNTGPGAAGQGGTDKLWGGTDQMRTSNRQISRTARGSGGAGSDGFFDSKTQEKGFRGLGADKHVTAEAEAGYSIRYRPPE